MVFLVSVSLRFSHRSTIDESPVGKSQLPIRLVLIADFSPNLPSTASATLHEIAQELEKDPLRKSVLQGRTVSEEESRGLPEGYRQLAQWNRGTDPDALKPLQLFAEQARSRFLMCAMLLGTLVLGALVMGCRRHREGRAPTSMTSKGVIWCLGLFFAWDAANLFGVSLVISQLRSVFTPFALIFVAQAAGYGLLLFFLGRARDSSTSRGPASWNFVRPFPMAWVGRGYLLCYPIVLTVNAIIGRLRGQAPESVNPLLEQFMQATPLRLLALACLVVVVGPVFEELLFRGWLLGSLRESWGDSKALVFSSVLFALIHGDPWATPALFVLGMVFGGVYLKTGSLFGSILLHGMWNLTTFTFLLAIVP